jgi:hypothetical protein
MCLPHILFRTVGVLRALDVGIREGHKFPECWEGVLAFLKAQGAFEQPFPQCQDYYLIVIVRHSIR